MSTVAVTLIVLWLSSGVSAAHGEAGAVLVVGKATPKDRITVASAVRSAARGRAWQMVDAPLPDADVEKVVDCFRGAKIWSCAGALTVDKGIKRLILVRVEPQGKGISLTEQVLLPGSNTTTTDQGYCNDCTDELLARVTFDLTDHLLLLASASAERTKLEVRSSPPGAWITLDQTNVGLTDHTYSTYPGHHVVVIQRDGYEPETRGIDVPEDRTTVVSVELHKKDSAITSDVVDHRRRNAYLIGGAGLATAGLGVVLQVAKDPPDSGHQPTRLYSVRALVVVCLVATTASAHANTLVFDACEKACSNSDLTAIALLRRALANEHVMTEVIVDPEVVLQHLGPNVPLPAVSQPRLSRSALTTDLKLGIELLAQSKNEESAEQLGKSLETVKLNPGLVVSDPTLRELVSKARLSRAIAFIRVASALSTGDKPRNPRARVDSQQLALADKMREQAYEAIADYVRASSLTSIADRWGPEAGDAFEGERKKLLAQGVGDLLVQIDDPTVLYYIDPTAEPRRGTFATRRLAGPVQVIALDSLGRSRRWDVTVAPGLKTTLEIHWFRDVQFEAMTSAASGMTRIGFNYLVPRTVEDHEAELVRAFGVRANAREIIVVGPTENQIEMGGATYDANTGVGGRRGTAATQYADELAAYLLGVNRPTPHVHKGSGGRAQDSATVDVGRRVEAWHLLGWGVGLGGLAAAPLGFRADATNKTVGFAVAGATTALGVLTTILYFTQSTRRRIDVSLVPSDGGVAATLGGVF